MKGEIITNTVLLLNPWQPRERMEVLIDRCNQAHIYSFFAKARTDNNILVTYFLTVTKKTDV